MKFEIYKGKNGKFYWRLKASNGETIADGGQGYAQPDDAMNGIAIIKRSAATAEVVRLPDEE